MLEKLKIVALLPMKAHSSRVKGKNFRKLNGKPLFRWMLDTLVSIPEISKVVINTDARGILQDKGLQESEKIMIRDRKKELCGDEVSMNLVLADDVMAIPADIFLMTHTTNPLLSVETVQSAIKVFLAAKQSSDVDSLFTVNRIQTRFYREDLSPVNHDPNNLIPTQDLEPWYEENSNLYLFTADSFTKTHARIGKKPIMFETPRIESVDIDEEEDWTIAQALASVLHGEGVNGAQKDFGD